MQKRLDGYRGKLSAAEIASGMTAAARNSKRLSDDAKTLLEMERHPSATSLAILSIEEAGKVSILRELALARNGSELKSAWRRYRSHVSKNVAWILPQLVGEGARYLDDLKPIVDQSSDHPYVLDQLKQVGFYTDCLGERHWSIPEEVVDRGVAESFVRLSQILATDRTYTPTEIELWIEHLGPVWMQDAAKMRAALRRWASAMEDAGLGEQLEGFEDFVQGAADLDG